MIFTIFNAQVKDADFYKHNDSTWLIFTNKKKWVFELTKEGTLWYNYYFFKNFFELLSLDVIENQNYITEWVEDTIQNGVKDTKQFSTTSWRGVDDAIQNGVKYTSHHGHRYGSHVDDTIENGVKCTNPREPLLFVPVDDTIQNGVKETKHNPIEDSLAMEEVIQNGVGKTRYLTHQAVRYVEDTIQNGVKYTHLGGKDRKIGEIKDIIQNGVKDIVGIMNEQRVGLDDTIQNGIKETKQEEHHRLREVVQTVKNGIKETNPHFLEILNPINFEPVIKEMKRMNEVNIVLEKSIKGVKELPDKSGELRGYGDYYHRQEDKTKPHTQYVDDVITNGIKKTKAMDEWVNTDRILDGVIRDGVKETWEYEKQPQMRVNEAIRGGVKETNWRRVDNHPTYLDKIIKSNSL